MPALLMALGESRRWRDMVGTPQIQGEVKIFGSLSQLYTAAALGRGGTAAVQAVRQGGATAQVRHRRLRFCSAYFPRGAARSSLSCCRPAPAVPGQLSQERAVLSQRWRKSAWLGRQRWEGANGGRR